MDTTKYQENKRCFAHIERLLSLNTCADLIAADVYPNCKELTESAGAYHAYFEYIHADLKKRIESENLSVSVYAVADGHSPRTGLMFALRAPYRVYSIDPEMNTRYLKHRIDTGDVYSEWRGHTIFNTPINCRIKRLTCHKMRIENFIQDEKPDIAIIAAVHSHVSYEMIRRTIKAKNMVYGILMPCCCSLLSKENMKLVIEEYNDVAVMSPMNKIYVTKEYCFS